MGKEQTVNQDDFLAGILAAIDFDQPAINQTSAERSESLTEKLNSMVARGIVFDVAADRFEAVGDNLSDYDRQFLAINSAPVLCTLQQVLLVKHLFEHSKDSLSDFAFEIFERESLMVEQINGLQDLDKIFFESVADVSKKWFAERLLKESF